MYRTKCISTNQAKGAFNNNVGKLLSFFDPLPPYVDIFYLIKVDKNSTFFDYLTHLFLSTQFVNNKPLTSKMHLNASKYAEKYRDNLGFRRAREKKSNITALTKLAQKVNFLWKLSKCRNSFQGSLELRYLLKNIPYIHF